MRTVLAAAIIALLTASAYCQISTSGGRPSLGIPLGDKPNAPADPRREEHESAYKSAIEKIPPKQKTDDPWQGVRSSSTPQPQKGSR